MSQAAQYRPARNLPQPGTSGCSFSWRSICQVVATAAESVGTPDSRSTASIDGSLGVIRFPGRSVAPAMQLVQESLHV